MLDKDIYNKALCITPICAYRENYETAGVFSDSEHMKMEKNSAISVEELKELRDILNGMEF